VAADDTKGAGERDPVGVVTALEGGLVHQVPQCVVHQQEREDLLLDPDRVLGTQHQPGPALMVLDLVQGVLDLPPLGIQGRELGGGRLGGIEDGGDLSSPGFCGR
jgi:hypothetical protein